MASPRGCSIRIKHSPFGFPLTIEKIEGNTAISGAHGISQTIRIDFIPDVQIGDEVMVHAGFAIEKVDSQEAQKTRDLYQEIFNAFQ